MIMIVIIIIITISILAASMCARSQEMSAQPSCFALGKYSIIVAIYNTYII